MKLQLDRQFKNWDGKPMFTNKGEAVTLYSVIIPSLYNAFNPEMSRTDKEAIVDLADKIKGCKVAKVVDVTLEEALLIRNAIEPSLVAHVSRQFCVMIEGPKAKIKALQTTKVTRSKKK